MSVGTYFCFCCLSTKDLLYLFEVYGDKSYTTLLKDICNIKLSHKDYIQDSHICTTCVQRLTDAHDFRMQVLQTLNILRCNGLLKTKKMKAYTLVKKVDDIEAIIIEEQFKLQEHDTLQPEHKEHGALQLHSEKSDALQIDYEEKYALHIHSKEIDALQLNPDKNDALQIEYERKYALHLNSKENEALQLNPEDNDALQIESEEKNALHLHPEENYTFQAPTEENDTLQAHTEENDTLQAHTEENETLQAHTEENDTLQAQTEEKDTLQAQTEENETLQIESNMEDAGLKPYVMEFDDIALQITVQEVPWSEDSLFGDDEPPENHQPIAQPSPKNLFKTLPIERQKRITVSRKMRTTPKLKDSPPLYKINEDFSCDFCSEILPNLKVYHKHMNSHFPNHICEVCGKEFLSVKRLKRHKSSHQKGQFACDKCDAVFSNYNSFNSHKQKKHGGTFVYRCTLCEERFATFNRRMLHLADVHGQTKKKYKCSMCPNEYLISGNLSSHIRRAHLKEKKYFCSECELGFFQKQELKSHIVTHFGSKDHKCTICGKTFLRKKALNVHMKIHTNDRKHVCETCGKSFVQKCTLLNHVKVHNKELAKNQVDVGDTLILTSDIQCYTYL